jgi:hypothetical protein
VRDGEEVLKRVRAEVQALKTRYETQPTDAFGVFLTFETRHEYLEDLEPLAYLPEPHPPPPVIECDECEGKGFVWGNVQGPVKVDCADCNGLGYLYDPCFHCGHHDPMRDPVVSCYYCENWPLGTPSAFTVIDEVGDYPSDQALTGTLERFQYLGSLAESEDDVMY